MVWFDSSDGYGHGASTAPELAQGWRTQGCQGTGHRPFVPHQHPPARGDTATSPPLCTL